MKYGNVHVNWWTVHQKEVFMDLDTGKVTLMLPIYCPPQKTELEYAEIRYSYLSKYVNSK